MARWRGLWGGLAALALMWASMQLLSSTLMRLPWAGLAARPELPPPVAPVFEELAGTERALTAGKRGVSGSVPLYREARPQPRWAPPPSEPEPVAQASRPAPAATAQAAQPAAARPPSRFRLDALPALGEAFGAAPGGGPAPQSTAAFPAQTSGAPPRDPDVEEAPAGGAWDQGPAEPAPAKRARVMRAVPQGGSAPQPKPVDEEPEDDP